MESKNQGSKSRSRNPLVAIGAGVATMIGIKMIARIDAPYWVLIFPSWGISLTLFLVAIGQIELLAPQNNISWSRALVFLTIPLLSAMLLLSLELFVW